MSTTRTESESVQTSDTSNSDQSSNKEPSPEAKHRARMLSVATGAACAFLGATYILYRQLNLKAAEMATVEVSAIANALILSLVLLSSVGCPVLPQLS